MRKILIAVILIAMLAGCSQKESVNVTDKQNQQNCSDFIKLHQNGVTVYVNKQRIILVEQNGSKSAISFDGELEQVNGMTRGNNETFDESQEEVIKIMTCEK